MNKFSNRITPGRVVRQSGFTLIEVMVVVVIIGLLSAMIIPNLVGKQDRAFRTKAMADIGKISTELEMYRLDNFSYPTTSEGLQALVTNPGAKKNWSGYLKKMPSDPWGNDYQYLSPGQKNPQDFDLWSLGADNAPGGEGVNADIGNWDE